MRHILLLIATVLIFGSFDICGQDKPVSKPIVLSVPKSADPSGLLIKYFLKGPFGGGDFPIRTNSKKWDYEIPTSYEGKAGTVLRIIVISTKYQTRMFDLPDLETASRKIDLDLVSRPPQRLHGIVLLQSPIVSKGLEVRVFHIEEWHCSYYGFIDCFSGMDEFARAELDENGRFSVDLPDFANDSVIASLHDSGEFMFDIRERKTGNIVYNLNPVAGHFGKVPVAASYPAEQVFQARRSE